MRARVDAARVAHLATVGADGRPHLVPVCPVRLDDRLYHAVDHKPKRGTRLRRLTNIEATGNVSLLVDAYDDDWSRLWWVRLDGTGRLVADPAEASAAIAALTAKYPQYVTSPPAGPVIAMDVLRWTGWSYRS